MNRTLVQIAIFNLCLHFKNRVVYARDPNERKHFKNLSFTNEVAH